jgi:hypothetical protein
MNHLTFPKSTQYVPVLLLCFLLFFPLVSSAQKIAPTTPDEYNYGAVGYKIQLNAKLPVKQGYSIKEMQGCEEDDRKIEFKAVYRDGESVPCIVIMVYTKLRVPPMYYCIPTADADPALWKKYHDSLTIGTDNPADQLQFFTRCVSQAMMEFSQGKK